MLIRGEWAEPHQIWPGHFTTIGQRAAELRTMRSIFTVRFSIGDNFELPVSQRWGATYIKFGQKIEKLLSLRKHLVHFRYTASLRNQGG